MTFNGVCGSGVLKVMVFDTQSEFKEKLAGLGKLNEFLEHSVFQLQDVVNLTWKHRSIQEFFAGLWIVRYADQEDLSQLFSVIRSADSGHRAAFEWTLRFAVDSSLEARRELKWLRLCEELFRPGDGTGEGTFRPTEFMFRAWNPLTELATQANRFGVLAREIIDNFQSEFREQILSGNRGGNAKAIGDSLLQTFVVVDPSKVSEQDAVHGRLKKFVTKRFGIMRTNCI